MITEQTRADLLKALQNSGCTLEMAQNLVDTMYGKEKS